MSDTVGSHRETVTVQERAEKASQRILAAVSEIERSSPAVLREIRDSLEIEIMIDRSSRPRRRLLRTISEYRDQRIRDKERDPAGGQPSGMPGALRSLISRRPRPGAPGQPS